MIDNLSRDNLVKCYGPQTVIARARFLGQASAAPTLLDNLGVKTITQSSTTSGIFTVTLAEKFPVFDVLVWTVGDNTVLHDCPVTSIDFTAGTFVFTHYKSASDRTTTASVANNGLSPNVYFHILVLGRGSL